MKTTIIIVSLCVLSGTLLSQKNSTEITVKVSETSGFLGMGKARFAKIALTSYNREKVLTSDNVNAGSTYYFTLKDSTAWEIGEDFINEELPKLTILQDSVLFHLEASGPILREGTHYLLLLTCKKNLSLHKPLFFSFRLEDTTVSATMNVPQHYWPGYKKFTQLMQDGDNAFASEKFLDAIALFDQLLLDQSLNIFPDFEKVGPQRIEAYQKLLNAYQQQFQESLMKKPTDTKQTITSTGEFLKKYTAVLEKVGSDDFQNLHANTGAPELVEQTQTMLTRIKYVGDSLHQALDDQTISFIIQGSSAGKIDFKYKYIIEALAHAYLSLNFSDRTATSLNVTVPEDLSARLKKYALQNAFETFLRVVNDRWVAKKPMFPEGFLTNLVKDSSQFPLPFYSMLKAVQDFYGEDYASAKTEIIQVMKKSYMYELTERVDQLRILINTTERKIPDDVLQRLSDGIRAEEQGNTDKAIEQYKDAMLIAEDYAPAAFALGKLYDRNGDSYTANNFFQKAIAADSQYYSAYRFLYINFFKNAVFKPMIDLLTQALASGNDFYDFHYYLGIAYNGSSQYDLAISQYERALELNNKSIDANIQAGISYQNLKSYSKAREYFKRAITIDPENQTATDNLKRLDELQKKF